MSALRRGGWLEESRDCFREAWAVVVDEDEGEKQNVVFKGMGVSISSERAAEDELEEEEEERRECFGDSRQMRSCAGSRKRVSISAMGFLVAR